MAEWCNSFVLVPKPNDKIRLCLDAAILNQALIRLLLRGPTLNDIFPKLNNIKYLSLIDANFGHTTSNWRRDHTSQHSHASLAGTDKEDYHLEQSLQGTCFSAR